MFTEKLIPERPHGFHVRGLAILIGLKLNRLDECSAEGLIVLGGRLHPDRIDLPTKHGESLAYLWVLVGVHPEGLLEPQHLLHIAHWPMLVEEVSVQRFLTFLGRDTIPSLHNPIPLHEIGFGLGGMVIDLINVVFDLSPEGLLVFVVHPKDKVMHIRREFIHGLRELAISTGSSQGIGHSLIAVELSLGLLPSSKLVLVRRDLIEVLGELGIAGDELVGSTLGDCGEFGWASLLGQGLIRVLLIPFPGVVAIAFDSMAEPIMEGLLDGVRCISMVLHQLPKLELEELLLSLWRMSELIDG